VGAGRDPERAEREPDGRVLAAPREGRDGVDDALVIMSALPQQPQQFEVQPLSRTRLDGRRSQNPTRWSSLSTST
jgi:hypothetical protein